MSSEKRRFGVGHVLIFACAMAGASMGIQYEWETELFQSVVGRAVITYLVAFAIAYGAFIWYPNRKKRE